MCCARVSSFLLARATPGQQLLLLLARETILCLRWNFLLSMGKQLPNIWGLGTICFHNFSGRPDSVFRRHAMPPVLILGHNGDTMAVNGIVPRNRACEMVALPKQKTKSE